MAEDDPWAADSAFLVEVAVSRFERQKSQTEIVNAMPLYPTETILWDENQVPQVHYTGVRAWLLSPSSLACWLAGMHSLWLTLCAAECADRWWVAVLCQARRAWRCPS